MLKRAAQLVVMVAALAIVWRWASERVLTVDLQQDVVIIAPLRVAFELLSDVQSRFHKIHPLFEEPLTAINRHVKSRETIEWKFRGKPSSYAWISMGAIFESHLTVLSDLRSFTVSINASNWLDSSLLVFHLDSVDDSNSQTRLTVQYQLYFPWLGKLILQSRIAASSKDCQHQILENAKILIEADSSSE